MSNPATYIITYDQRTNLVPLIVAFYTGLHKYFRILGPIRGAQKHIILWAHKYGTLKCIIQLHRRPGPRNLYTLAYRDYTIGIWTPCDGIIRLSVLK